MSVCMYVAVRKRKLNAAVLARSSREISQTVRIDCHSFLSLIGISGRRNTFVIVGKPKTRAKNECSVDRQRHVETATT